MSKSNRKPWMGNSDVLRGKSSGMDILLESKYGPKEKKPFAVMIPVSWIVKLFRRK